MTKYVYLFSEGNGSMRELLGGKGANLAEMKNLGLPVPDGFTITTEACNSYYENGKKLSDEINKQIFDALEITEKKLGKKLGDTTNPLLVSVRSGARASMPGMMDTILNLGLNDQTVEVMAKLTNNVRFAYDSYRRFIQMFSDVVMELPKSNFERILDKFKENKGVKFDTDLTADDLKEVVVKFKELYKKELKQDFPQDPIDQLMAAVLAVFRSWDNPRAIYYRRMNDIPGNWGTAVNVQSMVFGNMGNDSGTGVAFTRNPATGEKALFGEYLMNAQGEDVVAGIRTPQPIAELEKQNPEVFAQFVKICDTLENHYRDMQDMEFTIEKGKLYMLQTRNGKRTPAAALKIAVDMLNKGIISETEAVMRIEPKSLDALLHPQFDAKKLTEAKPISQGLAASPGAASGIVCTSAKRALQILEKDKNAKIIIVRLETSPEDIEGMAVSQGILTARGGMTSHAAVVARGMGRCCVSGCPDLKIEEDQDFFYIKDRKFVEGEVISLDGSTGNIYEGALETVPPQIAGDFGIIMDLADKFRTLKVRTNADTPHDAEVAVDFGAQGIGLCRTEHMFFGKDRIQPMREMIVSDTLEEREKALSKLLKFQRADFEGIFRAMQDRPVTIRFLDPPLHEFLPTKEEDIVKIAKEMKITVEKLKSTITKLHEFNPMLGHRGCRLSITFPEIAKMQTRAVIEAAINVRKEGINVIPEIMIPLVGDVKELEYVKAIVDETAKKVMEENKTEFKYLVGTMIEIPRAALTSGEIAKAAEFFSFGTNDLTQMTFGFSRDDAGKFLPDYYAKKIFESDPFARVDQIGVGRLIKMSVKEGKETRPKLKTGICGEHGGDPSSIEFCHNVGLEYVSCSPFRVPIARLAAAQAAIKNPKN
ncbi:MAG TPA: pyruvate, phosphate dikinase [Eubacteriales bacterium]|nr:pyruvate, phosphate dikinase [Eubacteriales bacterium]